MTLEEKKEWLNRAFNANNKARALKEFAERCREDARRLTIHYGNDAGKSASTKNGTENALVKLADMELKAEKQKIDAVNKISEVQDAIASIGNDALEAVLINRYLNFHTIDETAEIMHYGRETVKRKTNDAVEKLSLKELE